MIITTNWCPFVNVTVVCQDTIKGFQEILSGQLDSLPEGAFYMSGNIDEVKETAAKLASA